MRTRCWHKPIGEILISRGLATRTQLELALALQERLPGRKIGEILVELGYVKTRDILRAHAEQLVSTYAKSWAGWRES